MNANDMLVEAAVRLVAPHLASWRPPVVDGAVSMLSFGDHHPDVLEAARCLARSWTAVPAAAVAAASARLRATDDVAPVARPKPRRRAAYVPAPDRVARLTELDRAAARRHLLRLEGAAPKKASR